MLVLALAALYYSQCFEHSCLLSNFAMMFSLIDIFSRCCRWCRRFRKRCGYGIHSPFAFNLVTGVIYERGVYYPYERLSAARTRANVVLREKDDCLLFRLVNHISPAKGVAVSSHLGITKEYLRAGRMMADWHFISPNELDLLDELLPHLGAIDFLYVDDSSHTQLVLKKALPYVHDGTAFVIRHIHHNAALFAIWQLFIRNPQVRVTFDLYDFGLIYFESRLNKEDYLINYF